jgi:hypothetical protein
VPPQHFHVLLSHHPSPLLTFRRQAIRDVPEESRRRIIAGLSNYDIRLLWQVAGARYAASKPAIAAAIGPEYTLLRDMPADQYEIVTFRGRAALPTGPFGLDTFAKAFFLRPPRKGDADACAEDCVYGRVVHPFLLLNRVWPGPMYFRCSMDAAVVPGTNELCDFTIEYLDPEDLDLMPEEIPRASWPGPKRQRAPFDEGFVDYVRLVGPGVVVGMGMRTHAAGSGVPVFPSPLYFVMAKDGAESMLN